MADWKIGDLVRLDRDLSKFHRVPTPAGQVPPWGLVVGRHPMGQFDVLVGGACASFGRTPPTVCAFEEEMSPFVRGAADEPAIEAAVVELLVAASWRLPGESSLDGDVLTVRDRWTEKAYRMNPVVAGEVVALLGDDLAPNEDGHALLDRAGVPRARRFHVTVEAYEADFDRRGHVVLRDVGLDETHIVKGELARSLVRLERSQPRFASDGKLAAALQEALPLPRTMRLDTKYSRVVVKVVDLDGDAVQIHRDDEVSTFAGKDGKKVRKAARDVFDIARWTRDKLPSLVQIDPPSGPSP